MVNTEDVAGLLASDEAPLNLSKLKNHGVPLDHFDFKYIQKCNDVKELEKMYRVLEAGVEGKYPELESQVYEKLKELSPNSRALRKDAPVIVKQAMPKTERLVIDQEMEEFLNSMPKIESKLKSQSDRASEEPPIRSAFQSLKIHSSSNGHSEQKPVSDSTSKSSNTSKSVKPKDYREWAKIEQQLDTDSDENDQEKSETKKETKKATADSIAKVTADKTVINDGMVKSLIKNLPKEVETSNLDEEMMTIKAEQEKCKGNEAFSAGSFDEALIYYTRSIQYLPTSASYNNRALTYIKLENWPKAIEDCNQVLQYEKNNFKALLRRATAYFKQKSFDEAKIDLDKCLQIDPKDKKAQELQAKLASSIKEDVEARERIKKAGGKRLNIEETDGSDQEDKQDTTNVVKKQVNGHSEAPKKPGRKDNSVQEKKRQIKIAEVEEDSESEEITQSQEEKKPLQSKNITQDETVASKKTEPLPAQVKPFELPRDISEAKDQAIKLYSAGNYGEARDKFTTAIDKLTDLTDKEHLGEIKSLLAILYSNRASCAQNIGNFKSCINDCDLGLTEIDSLEQTEQLKHSHIHNTRLKLIWKRACSLEAIEKYKEALKAYETLMRLDSQFKNVQLNYNRVKNMLIQSGEFDKPVKKATPVRVEQAQDNKLKEYDEYKQKGNDFVKQNNYQKACEMYSKCVEIDPANPVAYLNRSLCYVKLNKPDSAISDSNFVLQKEEKNVKALYRRAMAYRQKDNLSQVVKDLTELLKIEPQNQMAVNELKQVQSLMSQIKPEKKERGKVLIEEYESIAEKIEPIKDTKEKPKQPTVQPTTPKPVTTSKPEAAAIKHDVVKQAKTFDKSKLTNGYEFLQAWNSINPSDLDSYTNLMECVDPSNLPKFIGSKLDDGMLTRLIKSIEKVKSRPSRVDYLRELTKTQRFNVIKLFMSSELKSSVQNIIEAEKPADAGDIRKAYD